MLVFFTFFHAPSPKAKKKTHRDIFSAYLKSLNCCAYQICLRWQWKIYNNLYGWHVWYWHTTHIQITSAQLEYPWESVNENYGILQCSGAYNLLNLFHIHKKKTFFSKVLVFGFAFVFFLFCITWSSAFIPKKYFSTRYQVEFALAFATSCTFLCNTQDLKTRSKFIVIISYHLTVLSKATYIPPLFSFKIIFLIISIIWFQIVPSNPNKIHITIVRQKGKNRVQDNAMPFERTTFQKGAFRTQMFQSFEANFELPLLSFFFVWASCLCYFLRFFQLFIKAFDVGNMFSKVLE